MLAHVLLVNDDHALLQSWALALVRAGYSVLAVGRPTEGLTAVESGEAPDVLVTPIAFGEGQPNGVSLANMVRRKRPGIGVVIVGPPDCERHTENVGLFLRKSAAVMELVIA